MPLNAATPIRIGVVANTSWYVCNFRLTLIRALRDAGHEVMVIAPEDEYSPALAAAGARLCPFALERTGLNPFRELATLLALRRLLREARLDAVFSFTPKCNIYTGIAMRGLKGRFVPNLSGLGRAFTGESKLRGLMKALFRFAFRRAAQVFFQNRDDLAMFVAEGLLPAAKAKQLPGSGVDLARFAPVPMPPDGPVFLLLARLIWEKGLAQYAEAAAAIKKDHPAARFLLLGPLEENSASAIDPQTLEEWRAHGLIEYLGVAKDVAPYIAAADCVVLPSYYREGVPRSLLEAAAMARPLITTDMPGCREAVEDGVNGFLCAPRDSADLTDKLRRFLALDGDARRRMGENGRRKMEREFDERIVLAAYAGLIDEWRNGASP